MFNIGMKVVFSSIFLTKVHFLLKNKVLPDLILLSIALLFYQLRCDILRKIKKSRINRKYVRKRHPRSLAG